LTTRSSAWAQALAGFLVRSKVSPNAISALSMGFAALGCAALLASGRGHSTAGFLVAAACVQLRLLCNLLDGMVAVEGGLKSPTGDLWNEVPDRVADSLFLVGAGHAAGGWFGGATLGWAAALAAMATAYARALGASLGLPQDFRGPMAKPHRMALLTAALVVSALAPWEAVRIHTLEVTLLGILLGSLLTLQRRLHLSAQRLRSR
jgi:phosphatidylglycerophosphate synthase